MNRAWTLYLKALKSRPIPTKTMTGLVITAAGDYIAQKYIEKQPKLQLKRFTNLAVYGFLVTGL